MALESRNPIDGSVVERYEEHTDGEIEAMLEASAGAAGDWAGSSFEERARMMRLVAQSLRADEREHAALMAREMGKPVSQGVGEARKCGWVCDYYADNAETFLAPINVDTDAVCSQVVFRPLGPVLAIMPWNFPFWQVFRFAAPALMAGNTVLLKHASSVTGCALAIERIFREAGFPKRVFRTLLLPSSRIRGLIRDARIAAVTLTGSTAAGRAVGEEAGRTLKKTVLELGGSDPYVILEDADLGSAADACVKARLINSGQSCIAAKRFIVVEAVYDRFRALFLEGMRSARVGDPMEESTLVGPMARLDLRDELHDQVVRTMDAGAALLMGGSVPDGDGAFYPPTVLEGVAPGMAAFDEETFGPVAALVRASGEEEAISLANASPFGLGAAVFTCDLQRGYTIAAERLRAGSCFVNGFVRSDPRMPFGGIAQSGYGRELAEFGIREFVNVKSVCAYSG